jgi:hypothetical protein
MSTAMPDTLISDSLGGWWVINDTLAARSAEIAQQLATVFTGAHATDKIASWTALLATLPGA